MTDTTFNGATPEGNGKASLASAWRWLLRHPPVVTFSLIVLVCLVVGTINTDFWQMSNLFDILRASVVRGLFALGVLVVLASGGIDVSFTAIAAFVMYTVTMLVTNLLPGLPMPVILLVAAAGGACFGALNGLLVHTLRAPSLIVTIGTQYVIRSFLLTFVGTALFMNIPGSMEAFGKLALFTHQSANGSISVLPAFVLVLAVAAVVTWWILERTLIGRAVYAVGGNPGIAERLGYNLRTVHIFVFAYAGLLAGIAGIMHVASNRLANPFDLAGTELEIIAAVVLGGARITGGSGSVIGTLLGVVLITLVSNVLILVGIPSTWQLAIIGVFIVLAGTVFSLRARG
ncbi:simple sugar transport system permease protein [Ensifer adhaerens]|uniref:Simple sugar transport system permease protein n=1 Tax=Ensifer adhaerens TaxID=106592 RepID=A0ACC5SWW4_ENSAD|nr:ABC transporter permease [Ensifer adhaerens]MBP1873098.1 simple sugar transport system permease protein [Ensifer adhaerens]